MNIQGQLHKMHTELSDPVQYSLVLNEQTIQLNELLGQTVTLNYTGNINCVACGRKTKKSFNQGYCYPCFSKLAQCDMCIMKPETCHYDQGTCREPEWGEKYCFQPHYVYLANSSGVKVGITRHTQVPTRWIDQGAIQALPIFKVTSRKLSGLLEIAFKDHVTDKTSWQKMLKGQVEPVDLIAKRDELLPQVQAAIDAVQQDCSDDCVAALPDAEVIDIDYPILQHPTKVKSFNFDKTPEVSGVLQGIKGQYLIFDTGVINIRKFSGYEVIIST